MNRIHIVGRKNHGKTTLVVDLTTALSQAGWRVGTLKHTHHEHEFDVPGKDSYRHRAAGAAVSGLLSPNLSAVFSVIPPETAAPTRYEQLAPAFQDCDLILVEGDANQDFPCVEVWRAELGVPPVCADRDNIALLVTDDPAPVNGVPVVPRGDLAPLLQWVEQQAAKRKPFPRSGD